jgi:hypothetical protein
MTRSIEMKRFFRVTLATASLSVVIPAAAYAESFETIINNGNSQNRLDIAILGDGYTAADAQKYKADVQGFVAAFFNQDPWKEYQRYVNVHRIDVVSNQSGADHPENNAFVDTALDAAYNCNGVQRLICVDNNKVDTVIANTLGPTQHDVTLVIVNDPVYGGSGGAIAVVSVEATAVEIILHELGHSFGLLGDEYGGPPPPACNNSVEPAVPNGTKETQRAAIKWNAWIDPSTPLPTTTATNGVPGLYEGSNYCDTGLYRPTNNSKMRTLGNPYEQINTEQLIRRIYNFVSPLDSSAPAASDIAMGQSQVRSFAVSVPVPFTHSLNIRWLVDGQQQSTAATFDLNSANLAAGNHTLTVAVNDPTTAVRSDPAQVLTAQKTWNVSVNASGTSTVLANIATRLRVETGDNALIGGFIVTGTQPKKVIVRAIGPSLPLTGALSDPTLELRNSAGGLIRANDNWRSSQEGEIMATTIPPTNDSESAIVETLPANGASYTAVVRGANNATGIGVVEVYDLDRAANSKLANISTRGFVNTGDNVMIGGVIVTGSFSGSVVVRGIGPSLAGLGITNALADPTLELRDKDGALVVATDNWQDDGAQAALLTANNLAPQNAAESGIFVSLSPASYTAIIRGKNNTAGVAVVEAYQVQ